MTERFARAEIGDGLVVLTEEMPGVRSVALGVWVKTGSVHEEPAEMGVSHMLEHMVFKGTTERTAHEIALVLERVGGSLDAYTTREHTCYQSRVLDEHLDIATDVLADLVINPQLRASDLELEREVVLEEISTVEDTPDDLVFDIHSRTLWGEHLYGFSILGTRDTVAALSDEVLRRAHARGYRQPNMVIAAAGSVEHAPFVARITELFASAPRGGALTDPGPPANGSSGIHRIPRQSAQTHIVFGTQVFGHRDPRRYALVMLSNAFGGGMSSRLFQKVREELGLAYAVYTYQSFHQLAGVSGVYVGTRHEWADRAIDVIRQEYKQLAESGLTPSELEDIKGQVKGQVVIGLESTNARLHRLAGTALFEEEFLTMEEVIRRVDAVTLDEVAALAHEFYDPEKQTIVRLGPA